MYKVELASCFFLSSEKLRWILSAVRCQDRVVRTCFEIKFLKPDKGIEHKIYWDHSYHPDIHSSGQLTLFVDQTLSFDCNFFSNAFKIAEMLSDTVTFQ